MKISSAREQPTAYIETSPMLQCIQNFQRNKCKVMNNYNKLFHIRIAALLWSWYMKNYQNVNRFQSLPKLIYCMVSRFQKYYLQNV